MRLPMKNGEVDYDEFTKMVDFFIESGLQCSLRGAALLYSTTEPLPLKRFLLRRVIFPKNSLPVRLHGFPTRQAD